MPTSRIAIEHHAEPEPTDEEILDMVTRALEPFGGMGRFVRDGARVVIKPNQTIFFHAKDGVTTDPRVVAALVMLAKKAGADEVVVGDGAGGDLRSESVLAATGIKRLAEEAGADRVLGFDDLHHGEVEVTVDGERYDVPVPRLLLDADVIINVPKAKTHFEDPITCCLKNWVGIIAQAARPAYMVDPLLFHIVAGVHERVPAALNVVDGLWAGEGNGPAANQPKWLGCVVAGVDPVATDRVVARLMGLQGMRHRFQDAAVARGIGTNDDGAIEVVGPQPETVGIKARPTREGFEGAPVRVLQGEDVTWAGSMGHLKSIVDVFDAYGFWTAIIKAYGRPTFMVGRIDDPDFERHVEEGPYFVIDDAALPRYKDDERTTVVPGHPATHNIFPAIFQRLHVTHVGPKGLALAKVFKQTQAYFHFRHWDVDVPSVVGDERRGP